MLAGSITSCPKSSISPKPHTYFNLRCEERIWRVVILHEDEVPGLDRLAIGDVLSVVGLLNIHPVTDSQGRKRLAYEVIGRQILLLRLRSSERARAMGLAEASATTCPIANPIEFSGGGNAGDLGSGEALSSVDRRKTKSTN
jgi:hypothetical protein